MKNKSGDFWIIAAFLALILVGSLLVALTFRGF